MISTIVTYTLLPLVVINIYSIIKKRSFKFTGYILFTLGLALLIEVILRSIEIRFPALTSLFEGLILLSGIILIIDGSLIIKEKLSPVVSLV